MSIALLWELPAWRALAHCEGRDDINWFPQGIGATARGHGYDAPRSICASCPVKQECLDFAIDNYIPHGMWGGMSPSERNREIHRRTRPRRYLKAAS